eukprot:PITA_28241
MFVPGLKKNLITVAVLEDHGYDVIFNKGKEFLIHIVMGQVNQFKVHVKNLYKLYVEDCVALSRNTKEELLPPKEEPQDVVEKPQVEKRVEITTQAEPSQEGRKISREAKRLLHDARENVGAPSNQRRLRRSLDWYTGYMALMTELIDTEPPSFEEEPEKPIWVDLMVEEYESIVKNSVWEVVPRQEEKLVVGLRCIFKVKHAEDGSIEKYKARFVAKGYSQVEGIYYEQTFVPVARYSSIRSILGLAAHMGWKIH